MKTKYPEMIEIMLLIMFTSPSLALKDAFITINRLYYYKRKRTNREIHY